MTTEVRDGVTVIDGAPRVLVTVDYPYYRDDPAVWADRLRAIRDELGIDVITSYLPWRHHQPVATTAPDFTDVVRFLGLCHELGLKVIAKPGPFIHAETDYGGLPDWICPETNKEIEPLLDASGEPSRWAGRTLPAPLGAAFAAHAQQWLGAVGKEVLDAATYPDGPVIMMQIANEGLFTNGALPLSAYDYSPSGLAFFRGCLQEWYGTPDAYSAAHGTGVTSWDLIEPPRSAEHGHLALADWGRAQARYLAEVYHRWADAVGCRVPVVVNLNPPTVEDLDDWLARVRPGTWDGIHYGFTNWMGVVSASQDAQARYVIAAKLAPGPNLEENWGFSELYDRAYGDATTSYHQTLLALAAGATGFNVYTGVSTSGWQPSLDSRHSSPYPDCAPIAADGTATEKAPVVKALADFFALHGAEFLASAPVTGGAFGLYLPYAGIGAWSASGPECGRSLRAFHDRMRAAGLDYAILDLETATLDQVRAHQSLTVPGGPFMHRQVQELLAAYLEAGGHLVVDGLAPSLDEHQRACTIVADALTSLAAPGAPTFPRVVSGEADAFLRVHGETGVAFLTVLVSSANEGPVLVETGQGVLEIVTCRGGAAVLRLVDGLPDDFVVKGLNAFLGSAVPASVALNGTTAAVASPADLARIGGALRSWG